MEDEAVFSLCDQFWGRLICFTSTVKEAKGDPDFGLLNLEFAFRTDGKWFSALILETFIRVLNPQIYAMPGSCLVSMLTSSVYSTCFFVMKKGSDQIPEGVLTIWISSVINRSSSPCAYTDVSCRAPMQPKKQIRFSMMGEWTVAGI